MKDVFYSKSDDRLFLVAGYTADDNTSSVQEKVNSLLENSRTFCEWAGCFPSQVKTTFVEKSRRYKYMRVFFIDKPKKIPKDAFEIRNEPNWGMFEFLQD